MSSRILHWVGLAFVVALSLPGFAQAGTIYKDTTVGSTTTATQTLEYAGGSGLGTSQNTWMNVVGSNPPFNDSSLSINVIRTAPNTLELQLFTGFTGSYFTSGDCFTTGGNTTCAYLADIALSLDGGATYGYGVSLGKEAPNGGMGTTGLYSVSSWKTSNQIWGGRSGFYFGGGWASCSSSSPCSGSTTPKAENVAITGGTVMSGSSTTVTDKGSYIDVVMTGVSSTIMNSNISLFWGTADCGNDPIAGTDLVAPVNTPEPGSAALLLGGLGGLILILRRRNGGLGEPKWQALAAR